MMARRGRRTAARDGSDPSAPAIWMELASYY
jgi:hypothetical protein